MKLEIWVHVDGSLEIMHVFFFPSYVENFSMATNKIDLKYDKYNTKPGSHDNAKSTVNISMKLEIWIDDSIKIMHKYQGLHL
jgi:hypothetical protein